MRRLRFLWQFERQNGSLQKQNQAAHRKTVRRLSFCVLFFPGKRIDPNYVEDSAGC